MGSTRSRGPDLTILIQHISLNLENFTNTQLESIGDMVSYELMDRDAVLFASDPKNDANELDTLYSLDEDGLDEEA